jgi:hypothetical protein
MSGEKLYAEFLEQGILIDVLQPCAKPWNPLSDKHPLLAGIDPVRSMRVLLGSRDYDLVLCNFESPAAILLLLRNIFHFRPAIVMVDLGLTPGWTLRDRLLDVVIPRIDGIITLGEVQVKRINERWKTDALVKFVPMQIDTDFYQPAPFSAGGPVLTVGDDGGRDFKTLASALDGLDVRLIAKTRLPIPLSVANPKIIQVKEHLDWLAWRRMFADARFVVVPVHDTVHASGVGALLESMAMGKAAIVSDSLGLRDYIVPDETALVVPCGDVCAMRKAIIRLTQDDALCKHLGSAARTWVVSNCSFKENARASASVLRNIVARKRPACQATASA